MGAFFGCCVIALVVLYVGRKIGRMIFALVRVTENHFDRLAYRDGMDLDATPIGEPKQIGKHAKSVKW